MTEELEMVEKIRKINPERIGFSTYVIKGLDPADAAAHIRAYGDRRVEVAQARIAELEAQLATVKDDCADKAVRWVNKCLCDEHMPLMCKRLEEDELRAAIKGE